MKNVTKKTKPVDDFGIITTTDKVIYIIVILIIAIGVIFFCSTLPKEGDNFVGYPYKSSVPFYRPHR
jgi:hypothetical protein